jgi:hypothetical protein
MKQVTGTIVYSSPTGSTSTPTTTPMLSPRQAMARIPNPVMISYQ